LGGEKIVGLFSLQSRKKQIRMFGMSVDSLHPTVAKQAVAVEEKYLFGA
jgi:hypothetical protein